MGERLGEIRELVHSAIAERMFPGAVVYVSRRGEVLFHEAFGLTTYEPSASRPIRLDDRFDLASLTKLYTTALVLRLVEQGTLWGSRPMGGREGEAPAEPGDPPSPGGSAGASPSQRRGAESPFSGGLSLCDAVRNYVPEVAADWTLEDLLSHRTGTTADLLGEAVRHGIRPCEPGQAEALWRVVFKCGAEVKLAPGQSHYSDVDFLLAQAVRERAAGRGLASLMSSELLEPLGLHHTGFCPGDPGRCVPTEIDDKWRHRLVVGEVHDEMAATLGGVAGHAGLFSTAAEVGRFCEMWLDVGGTTPSPSAPAPQRPSPYPLPEGEGKEKRGRAPSVPQHRAPKTEHPSDTAPAFLCGATLDLALRPHSQDFALGWRLCNASFFPSLERYRAVGHLGFTGTSAFLFPRSKSVFVLLSNRVYPSRDAAPSRLPLLQHVAEQLAGWAEEADGRLGGV